MDFTTVRGSPPHYSSSGGPLTRIDILLLCPRNTCLRSQLINAMVFIHSSRSLALAEKPSDD